MNLEDVSHCGGGLLADFLLGGQRADLFQDRAGRRPPPALLYKLVQLRLPAEERGKNFDLTKTKLLTSQYLYRMIEVTM